MVKNVTGTISASFFITMPCRCAHVHVFCRSFERYRDIWLNLHILQTLGENAQETLGEIYDCMFINIYILFISS